MTRQPGWPPMKVLVRFWIVVVGVYAAWIIVSGPRYGPDSQTYSRWADLLISVHFNIPAYLRDNSFFIPPVFYLLWTLVVAVLKATLGSAWASGVLALNWLSIGWGSRVTLTTIRALTASAAGLLLAVWLLLTAFDLIAFAPFVLSDLIFWAVSTTVIGAGLRLTSDDDRGPQWRVIAAGSGLTLIALAFRPTGIPLLFVWLLALVTTFARPLIDRFGSLLLAAVIAAAVAVMMVHADLMINPAHWPFGPPPPFLALLSDEYHRGVLVYAPESDLVVAPATSLFGAVRITLQKLIYFLTPWLPHFSKAHTLLNLSFFVPAYGLSAMALAYRKRLSPPQQRAAVLLGAYVIALSVFHAMLQIEFDHRYRLPMLPAVIMLGALGLEVARRPQTPASTGRMK